MPYADLMPFVVSACLGALIGLERQWEEQREGGAETQKPGLRTFVLWALLGTICAYLDRTFIPGFYPFGFSAVALLILGRSLFPIADKPPLGMTTASSALLTFFIGSLVYWGAVKLSLILSISMLLLLAGKGPIHRWSARFTAEDVRAALLFLALTGVVLPLAPNHDYGPYGAFNPFKIWLMVVLVAGLGFFGYVAVRLFGAGAGLGTMGVLGGLTSSTVTTLAFSRQSRERPALSGGFALAIVLACTIMLVRVAVMTAVVDQSVLHHLWPALVAMCLPGVAYAGWYLWRAPERQEPSAAPRYTNPLGLKVALQFAALYALVVLLARAGAHWFGGTGILAVSFLSGLTDMDAIALSLTQMAAGGGLDAASAARGITIGALSNTLVKAIIACTLGGPRLRPAVTVVFAATLLLGGGMWFFL
jgi:uncharacterized membrane protein (DUF4010 family)